MVVRFLASPSSPLSLEKEEKNISPMTISVANSAESNSDAFCNKWFLITVQDERAEKQNVLVKMVQRFTCMAEGLIEAVLQELRTSHSNRVLTLFQSVLIKRALLAFLKGNVECFGCAYVLVNGFWGILQPTFYFLFCSGEAFSTVYFHISL